MHVGSGLFAKFFNQPEKVEFGKVTDRLYAQFFQPLARLGTDSHYPVNVHAGDEFGRVGRIDHSQAIGLVQV